MRSGVQGKIVSHGELVLYEEKRHGAAGADRGDPALRARGEDRAVLPARADYIQLGRESVGAAALVGSREVESKRVDQSLRKDSYLFDGEKLVFRIIRFRPQVKLREWKRNVAERPVYNIPPEDRVLLR